MKSYDLIEIHKALLQLGLEEYPDEDLWEDGELNKMDVAMKLFVNIVSEGKWIVLRKLRKGESNG